MAKFRTGSEAIREAAESRGGLSKDFAPQLTWKGGETKYIQFITPLEEVPTVEMYQYILVGHKDNGDPMYRTFISPRDPALLAENPEARDYLRERGLTPRKRQIALAAELDPTIETINGRRKPVGFSVQKREYNRDGGTTILPSIGVIIQSHVFFGWFATFAQENAVEDHVFKITRRGNDQNTSYDCFVVGEAIDLGVTESELPVNFNEYLEELSSEERMRDYVTSKPDNWVFDRFANRNRKAASQPSPRYTEEEDVEEEQPVTRSRTRIAALRERVGASEPAE